jgi:hypothetical protein
MFERNISMAIIQISAIQHRSGNLVDLPQLNEAELGFATDTKQLFIGKTVNTIENIEVLTSYSQISFSQIDGASGNWNISNVQSGQMITYDTASNSWVNVGGNVDQPGNSSLYADHGIHLGNIANVKLGGVGSNGYVIKTDGTGNLSWSTVGNSALGVFPDLFMNGNIIPIANITYDLGNSTNRFKDIYLSNSTIYLGDQSISADSARIILSGGLAVTKGADLAEYYLADKYYEPGTVLEFGGEKEVTIAEDETTRVAGVVSTDPAYVMNTNIEGKNVVMIALQGRTPCKVRGKIRKGDMLCSGGDGYARPTFNPKMGTIIGKSLEDFDGGVGIIEIAVGRL